MTVHRPHPISGPWPYTDRRSEPVYAERHAERLATQHGSSLLDRAPDEDSVIYDDPEDALLFDDCDRCAQHAEHPMMSVDDERLGKLWREMVAVEKDRSYRDHYRTRAEAIACRELYRVAVFVERTHPLVQPWAWPWHVRAGNMSFTLGGGVGLEVAEVTFGGDRD